MDKDTFMNFEEGLDPRNIFSRSYELKELSTYKVGGEAAFYTKVFDFDGLVKIADFISENEMPILIVGNGSNLLIADSGFDGLVIQLGETFTQIEIDGEQVIAGGLQVFRYWLVALCRLVYLDSNGRLESLDRLEGQSG